MLPLAELKQISRTSKNIRMEKILKLDLDSLVYLHDHNEDLRKKLYPYFKNYLSEAEFKGIYSELKEEHLQFLEKYEFLIRNYSKPNTHHTIREYVCE